MKTNEIDMSNMSPYEISMVFSQLSLGLPFVWEMLDNESIQLYTMVYPDSFVDDSKILFNLFPSITSDWKYWGDIEVYTINLTKSSSSYSELKYHATNLKIKKGLI